MRTRKINGVIFTKLNVEKLSPDDLRYYVKEVKIQLHAKFKLIALDLSIDDCKLIMSGECLIQLNRCSFKIIKLKELLSCNSESFIDSMRQNLFDQSVYDLINS